MIWPSLELLTPPTGLPVSDQEARLHLKVDHSDENSLIHTLIEAATRWCEERLGRQFMTATWVARYDYRFPCRTIELPRPPLQQVNSIRYLDTSGVQQTVAAENYLVDPHGLVGRIIPAYGFCWPSTLCEALAIEIEFVAGWGTAADVPSTLKSAILLLVEHLYSNRGATTEKNLKEVPLGIESLLNLECPVL